jgi:rubrerythrin
VRRMRILIAALLAIGMLVGTGAAAVAAPRKAKASKLSGMVYVCSTCGVGAPRSMACPDCKRPMARLATYACMKCQISSDAPGPCPNCHEPMQSVAKQFRHCSTCGFYYSKAKKACPVCAKRHKLARR